MKSQRSGAGNMVFPPTPRDVEIMKDVLRLGPMTRQQIRRLHFRTDGKFASVQATCRRLRILTERGYLVRVRLPVAKGSGPYVYFPGPAGSALLGKDTRPRRSRRATNPSLESTAGLYHALEIVDFYIALEECLASSGGSLVTWVGETEARCQFEWHGKRVLLTPDAYCLWAYGDDEGAFFLEWDRGTESMLRLSQKLERYEAYYRLQTYHDHMAEDGLRPRILIVVPDERREKKVVSWMARRLAKGEFPSLPTVLVAVGKVVMGDPLGSTWRMPGHEQRMRMVD